MIKSRIKASLMPMLYALLCLALGLLMAFHSENHSPFDELRLLSNAKMARATFEDIYEKEYDEGATQSGGVYMFQLPGRDEDFYAATDSSNSYSPLPHVYVEYYPHNPSINRVQGEGIQTFFEWAWRFALRLAFLGLFLPIVWTFLKQARDAFCGDENADTPSL